MSIMFHRKSTPSCDVLELHWCPRLHPVEDEVSSSWTTTRPSFRLHHVLQTSQRRNRKRGMKPCETNMESLDVLKLPASFGIFWLSGLSKTHGCQHASAGTKMAGFGKKHKPTPSGKITPSLTTIEAVKS